MSLGDWGKLRGFVASLLFLQLLTVVFAWTLNPVSPASQTDYALLLASDLVAFSVISYVSRTSNRGEGVRGWAVVAGSAIVLFFMLAILFF